MLSVWGILSFRQGISNLLNVRPSSRFRLLLEGCGYGGLFNATCCGHVLHLIIMTNNTKEISTELRSQLLAFVADRLTAGEPLIAQGHFLKALKEGYQTIAGESPSEQALE